MTRGSDLTYRTAVFRADATLAIGTGHITRCLALADSLAAQGWRAIFACRPISDSVAANIESRGHLLIELHDESFDDEPASIAERLHNRAIDLAIVDHYGIGAAWHRKARAWSRRVMVIDDLPTRSLDADLLLNQNLGERADAYAEFIGSDTRMLIGPEYALLRPEFAAARRESPRVRKLVRRLLVFMGGTDVPDVTSFVVAALRDLSLGIDVVIGGDYPHATELHSAIGDRLNITVHRNASDMATLMLRADLAIGAPGSASWERCCLGLPAIMLTVAKNQMRAAAALEAAGAAVNLGWHTDVNAARLVSALLGASNPKRLATMSTAASAVTDGLGAQRVCEAIQAVITGGEEDG